MSSSTNNGDLSICGLPFFPIIGLKVTARCSMHCAFCCEPNRQRPDDDISAFRRIISWLAQAGTRRLCITGGEPLLYAELPAILTHAKTYGLENVLLTANGRLLMERPSVLRNVDVLRLSVHGPAQIHDAIVGRPGALADIEAAISTVDRGTILTAVTTVVTPETLPHVAETAEWCFRNRIERYYLFGVMPSGRGSEYSSHIGIVPDHVFDDLVAAISGSYNGRGMRVIAHPYRGNAECILVYGNGDVLVDPFHSAPTYQKYIGNVLTDAPQDMLERLRLSGKAWEDCIRRFERSTVTERMKGTSRASPQINN